MFNNKKDKNKKGLDWLARNLGYDNIEDLARENGYKSPEEMARKNGFKDMREYFSAPDYHKRMDELRRQICSHCRKGF